MNNSLFSLEGKTILITGASSGIGLACVELLDKMGANLVLIGRSREKLESIRLTSKGKHHLVSVDVTDYEEVNKALSSLNLIYDGIIHSAGISTTLPLKYINPANIDKFMQTNVYGAVNLTKLVTGMKFRNKEGMSVVFISSVMGIVGESGKTIYSLTKGALISGSKSLALELASKKIRVNCISPGVVETPMSGNAVYAKSEDAYSRVEKLHPLGLGKPEDIANTCVFLLSDEARWITGTNVIVDGGYTAK
ncbi:SDR family NAD(P)-dependent oxidoreductase [Myroides pelagicus]|uniref:SDR family oxidoreductase n=1 Tax=Myroides pelagicus TaxID=270914 RepID=A0A7K1GNE3_9FLAO|nr:SDR family oxidoreductase [Myroides pelagicus]MTH30371.1 SDR family oxidoreductase [Myroides pelagicus]